MVAQILGVVGGGLSIANGFVERGNIERSKTPQMMNIQQQKAQDMTDLYVLIGLIVVIIILAIIFIKSK